jgi:hypothetical protein
MVPEHPQYAMWNARYEAEQALARERAAWRTQRDADHEGWRDAWRTYRAGWHAGLTRAPTPPWWHLRAWWRLLLESWHPH